MKKQIGRGQWEIESRHVTLKGQGHDPNTLRAQYLLKTAGDAI